HGLAEGDPERLLPDERADGPADGAGGRKVRRRQHPGARQQLEQAHEGEQPPRPEQDRRGAGPAPGCDRLRHGRSVVRSGFEVNKPYCTARSPRWLTAFLSMSVGHFGRTSALVPSAVMLVYVVRIARASSGWPCA